MKRSAALVISAIALVVGAVLIVATMNIERPGTRQTEATAAPATAKTQNPRPDKKPALPADLEAIAADLRQRQAQQDLSSAEAPSGAARLLIEATDAALSRLHEAQPKHGDVAQPVASQAQQDLEDRIAGLRDQLDSMQP